MSEAGSQRLHSIVEGHVQGVGFRYFVVDTALSLGITGWVRNRFDGSVEVLAEGEGKSLNELILALPFSTSHATGNCPGSDILAKVNQNQIQSPFAILARLKPHKYIK